MYVCMYVCMYLSNCMMFQALRSPKHEQPGLQGIIELHRDFIGAAQMNPNSWLLHRDQVTYSYLAIYMYVCIYIIPIILFKIQLLRSMTIIADN